MFITHTKFLNWFSIATIPPCFRWLNSICWDSNAFVFTKCIIWWEFCLSKLFKNFHFSSFESFWFSTFCQNNSRENFCPPEVFLLFKWFLLTRMGECRKGEWQSHRRKRSLRLKKAENEQTKTEKEVGDRRTKRITRCV